MLRLELYAYALGKKEFESSLSTFGRDVHSIVVSSYSGQHVEESYLYDPSGAPSTNMVRYLLEQDKAKRTKHTLTVGSHPRHLGAPHHLRGFLGEVKEIASCPALRSFVSEWYR